MPGPGTMPVTPKQLRRICVIRQRLPVVGFKEMEGVAFYMPIHKQLKLLICFFVSSENKGPVPMETEILPWRASSDVRGMRLALETKMNDLRARIRAGTFPEKGLFLEQCNPEDDPAFLERVCASCKCSYCEIAVPC